MNILLFLIEFALLVIGGYLIANLIIHEEHKIEKYSLGFLLNLGIFTFLWFVINTLNIPFTILSSFGLLFLLIMFYLVLNVIFKKDSLKNFNLLRIKLGGNYTKLEMILIGLTSVLVLSSFINNIYWPVKAWDSLALYDFRALVFTKTGFMSEGRELGYFFQYPLFTTLFHTWVYVGGLNNPMFMYTFLYGAFLICIYFSLRKFLARAESLTWVFVVSSLPLIYDHSTIAYTNLPYSIFLIMAIFYFHRYIKNKKAGLAIVSSLLLSISAWTRYTEPFWIGILLFVTLYFLFNRKIINLVTYLTIFFVSKFAWLNFLSSINLGDYSGGNQLTGGLNTLIKNISLNKMYEVAMFLYKNLFLSWGGLFVVFVILFVRSVFLKQKENNYLLATQIILLVGMLIGGTYLFSFIFPEWIDIPDSATRMAMFFPPLFIYYIALELKGIYGKK